MRFVFASLLVAATATSAHADGNWGAALTLVNGCPATPPAVSPPETCLKTEWITAAKQCFPGVTVSSTSQGISIDHDGLALTLDTGAGVVKTRRTTSGLCIYVSNGNGVDFTVTRFIGDAPKLQVESGGENRVVIAVNATGLGVWNQPMNRAASKLIATSTDTFMDYVDDATFNMGWQPQNNALTVSHEGFAQPLTIDVPAQRLSDPNRWTRRLGGGDWEFSSIFDTASGAIGFAVLGGPQLLRQVYTATAPFTLVPTLELQGTHGTLRLFNARITSYVQ